MGSDCRELPDDGTKRVSIHAPAWGATTAGCRRFAKQSFQFTLPHGERPDIANAEAHRVEFQFTLPHGERPYFALASEKALRFQFTLPHGERPRNRAPHRHALGFNSRSRMGSDMRAWAAFLRGEVSIHAPAWGATRQRDDLAVVGEGFNSRSRMGSDLGDLGMRGQLARFNSRSRMGSDPTTSCGGATSARFNSRSRMGSDVPSTAGCRRFAVSIHAPAWGATYQHPGIPANAGFQFTLPHGERLKAGDINALTNLFQFTLPHGERRLGPDDGLDVARFNSRSRMGSDPTTRDSAFRRPVSIHAPAWGATKECFMVINPFNVSIHAPAWGATPRYDYPDKNGEFQFTLPHGERPGSARTTRAPWGFQFTLPHGERLRTIQRKVSIVVFQFTLPRGERPSTMTTSTP